jgi:hypothetical protein
MSTVLIISFTVARIKRYSRDYKAISLFVYVPHPAQGLIQRNNKMRNSIVTVSYHPSEAPIGVRLLKQQEKYPHTH